jgi:cell division protein FtsL
MTIVKTNNPKSESAWKIVFLSAGCLLVSSIVFCGFIYSKTVGLKHEIASYKMTAKNEKTENAELKNALFKMTDPQMLEAIAEEKGLVEDKNPQWVFASLR